VGEILYGLILNYLHKYVKILITMDKKSKINVNLYKFFLVKPQNLKNKNSIYGTLLSLAF